MGQPFCERCVKPVYLLEEWKNHGEGKCGLPPSGPPPPSPEMTDKEIEETLAVPFTFDKNRGSPPPSPTQETAEYDELNRLVAALLDAKRWLLGSEGYTEDHREFCRERFRTARAALISLYNRQREEIDRLQQRCNEGYAAHSASFGALMDVALLVNLDGVDDYAEVAKAVSSQLERLTGAQEAFSQAYYLITGRSPKWSSEFGSPEALQEIDDAQRLLRGEIAEQSRVLTSAAGEIYDLKQSLERLKAEPTDEELASGMYMADRALALETATDITFTKLHWGGSWHDAVYSKKQEYLQWAQKALAALRSQSRGTTDVQS